MDNPHMTPKPDCDHENHYDCGCVVVGMAYVPMQEWVKVRCPEEALARGTAFEDLDKPFFGEDVWA